MSDKLQTVKWVMEALGHPADEEYAERVASGDMPMNMAMSCGTRMYERMHSRHRDREMFMVDVKPDGDGRVVLVTRYVRLDRDVSTSHGPTTAKSTHMLACDPDNLARVTLLCNAINDTIYGTRYMVDMADLTLYTEDVVYMTGDKTRDARVMEAVRDQALRSNILYLPFLQAVREGNAADLLKRVVRHDSSRELLDFDPDFELQMVPVEELSRRHRRSQEGYASRAEDRQTHKEPDAGYYSAGTSTSDGGVQQISMHIETHDYSQDDETDTRS